MNISKLRMEDVVAVEQEAARKLYPDAFETKPPVQQVPSQLEGIEMEPSEPQGFDKWYNEHGHALGIGMANCVRVYVSAVQSFLCFESEEAPSQVQEPSESSSASGASESKSPFPSVEEQSAHWKKKEEIDDY